MTSEAPEPYIQRIRVYTDLGDLGIQELSVEALGCLYTELDT